MLVSFHKGFMMEGEATFKESLGWFRKEKVRHKIYSYTGISGICDESELEAEVERLTNKQLASSGWGVRTSQAGGEWYLMMKVFLLQNVNSGIQKTCQSVNLELLG